MLAMRAPIIAALAMMTMLVRRSMRRLVSRWFDAVFHAVEAAEHAPEGALDVADGVPEAGDLGGGEGLFVVLLLLFGGHGGIVA